MAQKVSKRFDYELYSSLQELDEQDQLLVMKAQQACDSSYSPYSNFRVGAALLLENGEILQGSNQENAAFPDGLCAERVAFFACGALHPGKRILKIAVAGNQSGSSLFVSASPCGSCRQVMLEYEGKQASPIALITRWGAEEFIKVSAIADLLPFSFSQKDLPPKL